LIEPQGSDPMPGAALLELVYEHGLMPLFVATYERGFEDGLLLRIGELLSEPPPPHTLKTWAVRGEPRARETFGQVHPDDYPGQDTAA